MLFFSDLDGTLLDAVDEVETARRHLTAAQSIATVVVVSSRTIPDLLGQFGRWGWDGDCIGENGGRIAIRDPVLAQRLGGDGYRDEVQDGYHVLTSGRSVAEWIDRLPAELAARASRRTCSVLFRPGDVAGREEKLTRACRGAGLHVADGGDFLAVWDGLDKGEAAARYAGSCTFAAIGNAENDLPLLERASPGFVIRTPGSGHHPRLARLPGAVLLQQTGAAGWGEALDRLRTLIP